MNNFKTELKNVIVTAFLKGFFTSLIIFIILSYYILQEYHLDISQWFTA